jgi:TonB-dependent receptor
MRILNKFLPFIILLAISGPAWSQGTFQGFILDSLTSSPLPGANVLLEGTGMGGSTNLDGHFRVPNIPPGSYRVRISYIGYSTSSFELTVLGKEVVSKNIMLLPQEVQGKEVVVTAQIRGQLAAINQQISSATIVNVVSEEKIQELPDANAAESIGRLPGVSIIRSGGEASKVVLRGLSSKFSNITVDGVTIPGTDSTSRDVDLSMISQGSLAGVELYKALLPDQDADAIAGTINLVTRKAPSERLLRFDLRGDYNRLMSSANQYDLSGRYGERFFDDVLGIQIQGNLESKIRSKENTETQYGDFDNPNLPMYDPSSHFRNDYKINQFTVAFTNETRKRSGGQAILDINTPDSGLVKISGLYNGTQRRIVINSRIYPAGAAGSTWDYIYRLTDLGTSTANGSLQGKNYLSSFEIEWSASYAQSRVDNPFDYEMHFTESPGVIPGQSVVSGRDHPELYIIPYAANDFSAAACSSAVYYQQQNFERERVAALNVAKKYVLSDAFSGELKGGGKYKERSRWMGRSELDDNSYLHGFYSTNADGSPIDLMGTRFEDYYLHRTVGSPSLSDFLNPPAATRNLLGLYKMSPLIDENAMKQWYNLNRDGVSGASLEYNSNGQAALDQYGIAERVSAAYLMNTLNVGREITFLAGLRVEQEANDYNARFSPGGLQTIGIVVTAPAGIVDTNTTYGETVWLPNAQLILRPTEFLTFRLAAYRALARPDYNLRLPQFILGTFTPTKLTLGNPNLRDTKAWNFEINTQVYGNDFGLVSVSVFAKKIDDMYHQMIDANISRSFDSLLTAIGVTWQDAEPFKSLLARSTSYSLTVPYNSSHPTYVWGLEFEHQMNFGFLPGYLANISLSYNVSLTRSETYIVLTETRADSIWQVNPHTGDGRWVLGPSYNVPIEARRQSENQPTLYGNAAIGYDIGGFSGRVSVFYQGQYVQQYSPDGVNDIRVDKFTKLDIALRQQLSPMFSVYLNINNVTNVQETTSRANTVMGWNINRGAEFYGTTADFGLRVTL